MPPTFLDLFGAPAAVVATAPGRVNLIGEHTDYNDGFVLPAAIPLSTRVELSPAPRSHVRAWSAAYPGDAPSAFPLDVGPPQGDWLDYVRGLTRVLRGAGLNTGFDVRIASDIPPGSGLSSSAALLVALARALRQAFALPLDDVAIAVLARAAETDYVGAPVGIMDPMACSLADVSSALFLDTRTLERFKVPIPASASLIVIDSGIRHAHAGGEYRTRREECRAAAAALGVRALRDLEASDLDRIRALPPPLDRRARHVFTENARVLETVAALGRGDLATVGRLFRESHESLRVDFEVSVPAVDALVEAAARQPAVYGARMTGGGFGGSIVALANAARSRESAAAILASDAQAGGTSRLVCA
jgi:galactokinase